MNSLLSLFPPLNILNNQTRGVVSSRNHYIKESNSWVLTSDPVELVTSWNHSRQFHLSETHVKLMNEFHCLVDVFRGFPIFFHGFSNHFWLHDISPSFPPFPPRFLAPSPSDCPQLRKSNPLRNRDNELHPRVVVALPNRWKVAETVEAELM